MTRVEAIGKARALFGHDAHALLRKKTAARRYVICRYTPRPHPRRGVATTILGEGTSWEEAFARASSQAV
jgi:hypothetical protein